MFYPLIISILSSPIRAQNPSLMIGTDIPYQFNIGASIDLNNIRFSLRSGVLIGPYSELTLSIIEMFGTDDIYIQLLESTFQLGYMNGLGAQYLFGRKQQWYIGPEFRFDYLSAAETSDEIITSITGEPIFPTGGILNNQEQEIKLGILLYAVGIRIGKSFPIASKHCVNIELSFFKHYMNQTNVHINKENAERLNENLNTLLWEEVFFPYGYMGGLGLMYQYKI